ncbi:hypothetical protein ANCCAN_15072 [Ancylostoma caninum]|uniref:Lactate/malate dehydrogenase C-terminal domain-containing protein n=1 Tax=Ancylostoma caninum TaxID=29170 RepID=A0A368G3J2_ANCCA|nr:hypothetical protein ANCCAN_15072 [Ancylostoma caninum]
MTYVPAILFIYRRILGNNPSGGMHGITDDVYLSLPCVVGINGITHVIKQNLSQEEVAKLHKSWKTLVEVQNQIKLDLPNKSKCTIS